MKEPDYTADQSLYKPFDGYGALIRNQPIRTPKYKYLYVEALWFNNFAINVKGRILVPLRAIFEQFHATVTWDQETQSIK